MSGAIISIVVCTGMLVAVQESQQRDAPCCRYAGFGIDACSIPDIDSDSRPDIAIGSAYFGSVETGDVFLFSSKTLKVVRRLSGRAGTGMFGEAIAPIHIAGDPAIDALAVSSRMPSAPGSRCGVEIVDLAAGTQIWDKPFDIAPMDKNYITGVWMIPLAPAVVGREQREKNVLASTALVCVRTSTTSVELCWLDCAKRVIARRATFEHVPDRLHARPLYQVGDVDSDGIEDVAVLGEDRVFICSAVTGARLLEIPIAANARLSPPSSACKGADYDGDGISDILIGRPAGRNFLADEADGEVSAYSAKSGKLLKQCAVADRCAGFGASLLACGTGTRQLVLVGKFTMLRDGVDVLSASTLERIASIGGSNGADPDVGLRLFDGADYDGDGVVDLLVSRYDLKSSGEPEVGVILYSGKDYKLLGRIELGALRESLK